MKGTTPPPLLHPTHTTQKFSNLQGLKCGVVNDMVSTGLGFWSYELGQTWYRNANDGQSPGPRERGFIGGFSALAVMTATLPLEVVLRRLQVTPTTPKSLHSRQSCSHPCKAWVVLFWQGLKVQLFVRLCDHQGKVMV